MPTPPNLPKPVWNLLAVFFAAWGVASAWLLLGGDTSAVVRLAFALCGAAVLFAGSVGGLLRAVGQVIHWFFSGKPGKCLVASAVLFFLWATFSPVFTLSREKVRLTSTMSDMKNEGLALLFYAESHEGILPPDMRNGYIDTSLATHIHYRDFGKYPPYGKPYVWCKQLAGLRLSDIAKPEEVVAAYSRVHKERGTNREVYVVLFLDGHAKRFLERQKTLNLIRERPALLAHAVRVKANRDAAVKPPMKKALP